MKVNYEPKYCDSQSILLVNETGNLRKLYCPFQVKCREITGTFKRGMQLWVDEVATNSKDELIYWIMGKPYQHTNFKIKATF